MHFDLARAAAAPPDELRQGWVALRSIPIESREQAVVKREDLFLAPTSALPQFAFLIAVQQRFPHLLGYAESAKVVFPGHHDHRHVHGLGQVLAPVALPFKRSRKLARRPAIGDIVLFWIQF